MKFIDEVQITVQSGDGGSGCVSFRRERFIPRGGPDGGDGGKGGDVILQSTLNKRTLYHFRHKKQFKAKNGVSGQGNRKTGKSGENIVLEVPIGTLAKDADSGEILKDFTHPKEAFVIARGGIGGRGNARFKSSTNRTPRFAQPGEPGETRNLYLELKLLADVGIVGLPNAGKSTLIRAVSSADPKIGDYPFTTLSPNLGVVNTDWSEPFIIADIPGLIEGAHRGAGLGIQFLRHIERTRILIHLIDVTTIDEAVPLHSYEVIQNELASYNENLLDKPQILVLNKLDVDGTAGKADSFMEGFKADNSEILQISAKTGKGLKELKSKIIQLLEETSQTK